MLVNDFMKICTYTGQLFDVKNGAISDPNAHWEYNLSIDQVIDTWGYRTIKQVFSDMSQEGEELLTSYNTGIGDEPEDTDLTTINLILDTEPRVGDRVIINNHCVHSDWVGKVGTVTRVNDCVTRVNDCVTDTTLTIKLDIPIPDAPFEPTTQLTMLAYKFTLVN